jgi:hypothetical protein
MILYYKPRRVEKCCAGFVKFVVATIIENPWKCYTCKQGKMLPGTASNMRTTSAPVGQNTILLLHRSGAFRHLSTEPTRIVIDRE